MEQILSKKGICFSTITAIGMLQNIVLSAQHCQGFAKAIEQCGMCMVYASQKLTSVI